VIWYTAGVKAIALALSLFASLFVGPCTDPQDPVPVLVDALDVSR